MTKEDAIQAMKEGKKVTHTYFDENEWMTIRDNKIISEDGYIYDMVEFWSYRTDEAFDDGYFIFNYSDNLKRIIDIGDTTTCPHCGSQRINSDKHDTGHTHYCDNCELYFNIK